MPLLPFLPLVGGALKIGGAIVGGAMVSQTFSAHYAPLLAPVQRRQLRAANRATPNSVPEFQALVAAYMAGTMEWCTLRDMAKEVGVRLGEVPGDGIGTGSEAGVWRRIIEAQLPILEWDM